MFNYLKRIILSFKYAYEGVLHAWRYEFSFRQEVIFYLPASILAFWIGENMTQVFWLIFSIFFILVTELLNTAVERTVDLVSLKRNFLAKQAKDLSAGAVLLATVFAAIVWVSIIVVRIL